MKLGLSEEQYKYVKNLVEPLEKAGASIWCFGSRARGDHKTFSDLDLLVESSSDLSREIGLIEERLENENFPFKVDIVERRNLAQSYVESVDRDRILF